MTFEARPSEYCMDVRTAVHHRGTPDLARWSVKIVEELNLTKKLDFMLLYNHHQLLYIANSTQPMQRNLIHKDQFGNNEHWRVSDRIDPPEFLYEPWIIHLLRKLRIKAGFFAQTRTPMFGRLLDYTKNANKKGRTLEQLAEDDHFAYFGNRKISKVGQKQFWKDNNLCAKQNVWKLPDSVEEEKTAAEELKPDASVKQKDEDQSMSDEVSEKGPI